MVYIGLFTLHYSLYQKPRGFAIPTYGVRDFSYLTVLFVPKTIRDFLRAVLRASLPNPLSSLSSYVLKVHFPKIPTPDIAREFSVNVNRPLHGLLKPRIEKKTVNGAQTIFQCQSEALECKKQRKLFRFCFLLYFLRSLTS